MFPSIGALLPKLLLSKTKLYNSTSSISRVALNPSGAKLLIADT
jgi:hypothetical protein